MEWIWKTLVAFTIAVLLARLVRKNKKKKLAPGPRGLPILGHLHLLGKFPHQNLHNLAKKHGPIMQMQFGCIPTIIVSSPQAAEQFLKNHDLVFASRPLFEAAKYISYEQKSFIFAPYGPYWRNMRKLVTLELLSNLKINSFQAMRKEENSRLVETLEKAAKDGVVVDLSEKISSLNANMTCRMVFGKTYMIEDLYERGFRGLMQESMEAGSAPNLNDYIPFLGVLDIQGLRKRFKAISKVFDAFLEKVIDEHEQSKSSNQTKDFVGTLLAVMKSGQAEFYFDRSHIKAILLDLLVASMDTSSALIEWTMSEILRHEHIMKKLQKELEEIVGMNMIVEESDLDSLEYLDMVVKESLRLHPVAPLLLPHQAMKDCTIDGFHIAKGSQIMINVWAIGRDPNVWTDPEKFIPERFIGSNNDFQGRDFKLIPFGSGRRSCPGMQLGLITVRLVIAQLLHCFDWKLPHDMMPTDLDMTEHFGFVVSRAKHLKAIPHFRLQK